MTIQNTSTTVDQLLSQILPSRKTTGQTNIPSQETARKPGQDIVVLSTRTHGKEQGQNNLNTRQSKLISEDITETENGFRRTQEFENPAGKKFTRVEEINIRNDQSKRIVIQQNSSGSTTALENVIDRQEDGSFRLIQRYTDETGVTKTNVIPDFNPLDADIALGRRPAQIPDAPSHNPFQATRGTQVNLQV